MRIALIVMLFVLSLFGGRLVQLQGLDSSALAAAALEKRLVEVDLPAHRGDILDTNGNVLATTVERRDLLVDQTLVGEYKRQVDGRMVKVGIPGAAEELAPLLGMSVQQVTAKLTGTSQGAYLARNVMPEVARKVLRLPIPGLGADQASRRYYPGGDLAGNLLGFVAADGKAYGGVESKFDALLKGTDGSITYEQGEDGTRIPTGLNDEVEPRDGGNVRLTIDRDLQWKAQELLKATVATTQAESATLIALDPRTGEVLTLATAPTYDPNQPSKAKDTKNRPLEDIFEPGSTAKVVTLAAALEEKVAEPLGQVTVPPRLERANKSFRDAEEHGVEKLTVAGVLAQSSNIGTILVGERVPPATMEAYQRKFGFGARTGVGLYEEPGLLDPASKWSDSQRYTVLFGQGLSVTALQAADVFATLANDGVRMQPRLVAGTTDGNGTFHASPATPGIRVVSAQTARTMRQMMEGVVVEGGTAVKAAVPGYRVAGKTGTANRIDDSCGCYRGYTASFIGMAPADDPALVVAVIVQNPIKGHYGGEVAAPVFQKFMTYALAQQGVPPTGTTLAEFPTRWH